MSITQSTSGGNQHNAAGIVRPIYSAIVSTVMLIKVRVPLSAMITMWLYSIGSISAIFLLAPDNGFIARERERRTGERSSSDLLQSAPNHSTFTLLHSSLLCFLLTCQVTSAKHMQSSRNIARRSHSVAVVRQNDASWVSLCTNEGSSIENEDPPIEN